MLKDDHLLLKRKGIFCCIFQDIQEMLGTEKDRRLMSLIGSSQASGILSTLCVQQCEMKYVMDNLTTHRHSKTNSFKKKLMHLLNCKVQ